VPVTYLCTATDIVCPGTQVAESWG